MREPIKLLTMYQLGNNITRLREERGLNQTELARLAKISQPTLWAIESGKSKKPRWETIVSISEALGVSPVYLSTGTGAEMLLTDDLKELLTIFAKLPPEQRQALIALIKSATPKKP